MCAREPEPFWCTFWAFAANFNLPTSRADLQLPTAPRSLPTITACTVPKMAAVNCAPQKANPASLTTRWASLFSWRLGFKIDNLLAAPCLVSLGWLVPNTVPGLPGDAVQGRRQLVPLCTYVASAGATKGYTTYEACYSSLTVDGKEFLYSALKTELPTDSDTCSSTGAAVLCKEQRRTQQLFLRPCACFMHIRVCPSCCSAPVQRH